MSQPIFTPPVSKCFCGAHARVIDWDSREMYRVMCDKNHVLSNECGTINRAVHRWNNRVEKIISHAQS